MNIKDVTSTGAIWFSLMFFVYRMIQIRNMKIGEIENIDKNIPFMPILSTLLNCAIWLKYGFLLHDMTMIIVNIFGLSLSIYTTITYYTFSSYKSKLLIKLFIGVISLVFYSLVLDRYIMNDNSLGTLGCLSSLYVVISPLFSHLWSVLFHQDTAKYKAYDPTKNITISPMISIISLLGSTMWLIYGISIRNRNIIAPNTISTIIAAVQTYTALRTVGKGSTHEVSYFLKKHGDWSEPSRME